MAKETVPMSTAAIKRRGCGIKAIPRDRRVQPLLNILASNHFDDVYKGAGDSFVVRPVRRESTYLVRPSCATQGHSDEMGQCNLPQHVSVWGDGTMKCT